MIKKLCLLIILAVVPVLMTHHGVVFATAQSQILGGAGAADGGNPTGTPTLDDTIKTVINLLSVVVGIAAVAMIIVAGLKYTTSGGNADKTKSAKNTLLYAIVGLLLVGLSQTIAFFVLSETSSPNTAGKAAPAGGAGGAPGGEGHQT